MLWLFRIIYQLISYGAWALVHLYMGKKALSLMISIDPVEEIDIFQNFGTISFFEEEGPLPENYFSTISE